MFNSRVGGTVEVRITPASVESHGGGTGGLGALVFVSRCRGLRVDLTADPFCRVVRDGEALEGDDDVDEIEIGRTPSGRGDSPEFRNGQGILVARSAEDEGVSFRVQCWLADLWGHHTFLGSTKEVHLFPESIRGQETLTLGLDMMELPEVRQPTPYKEPRVRFGRWRHR